MKRVRLLKYLRQEGCTLVREGGKHSIFVNMTTRSISSVPRHQEINDFTARKICKDLGIKELK
jgi:mRNA interferase HicA